MRRLRRHLRRAAAQLNVIRPGAQPRVGVRIDVRLPGSGIAIMTTRKDELEVEALELPTEDRADLARRLIESLEDLNTGDFEAEFKGRTIASGMWK